MFSFLILCFTTLTKFGYNTPIDCIIKLHFQKTWKTPTARVWLCKIKLNTKLKIDYIIHLENNCIGIFANEYNIVYIF